MEILYIILALSMIFLIVLGVVFCSLGSKILGVVCLLFGVCVILSLSPISKEITKKEEEYKKHTVTVEHSAIVKKLEYERDSIKRGGSTHTEHSMIMILEDGTVVVIDSKLYASLSEGMEVYWDVCVKNCNYFSDKRSYYIKNE